MRRSGSGLGLSVVWGAIKDHDGYIDVHSEKGKGTVFSLYLPISRDDLPGVKVPAVVPRHMGRGEAVLVVDDVMGQSELARKMLSKLNYNVSTVSSGEEAVEYLKERRADLILLDMLMEPGIDGLDTYKEILKIHPRQKAIIVSGFSETERTREAKKLGAGSYIKKPYMLETLGMVVRKELDRN
jgi:CheY-like chemotaxis protein